LALTEYSVCSGRNENQPWVIDSGDGSSNPEQHVPHASTIVFAHQRLHSWDPKVVREALETICKNQGKSGAWPTLSSNADGSVESTAMALHALALAQPGGWKRQAALAQKWLWSVQGKDGSWTEPRTPSPVYLTVLVLDAIALANGEKDVTIYLPPAVRKISQQGDNRRQTYGGVAPSSADQSVSQSVVGVSESASNLVEQVDRNKGDVKSTPRKKRGRPTKIPDESKLEALRVRGDKARARILYRTSYPTQQQVKNVPAILRHFRQTRQQSE